MSLVSGLVDPVFLSLDEVLEIHEQQIERYDGAAGLRDLAGLESAIATTYATFFLLNDWKPDFDPDELVDLVLSVASGRIGKQQLIEIFETRCEPQEGS